MQHVDALSGTQSCHNYKEAILSPQDYKEPNKRAKNIQNLKSLIGTNNATDFFTKNEILYKYVDGRELIAAPRDMQTELIKLAHEERALLIR
ncbi:transposon Tf2-9 polyprotein [Trichonephila clavipes]|nr:transposon Tf2-9 polyprotein [Trichonephila clavipes]